MNTETETYIMIKYLIKEIFPTGKPVGGKLTAKDRKNTALFFFAAFIIPFAFIIISASVRGFAPFGENTLMAIDAWGQYFPMLRGMKRAFRSLGFSYSFTGALGFDLTAQSAYYTNSPLWYLLFLLPGELTAGQVDMMVFIRFGLAGMTFFHYISSHHGKKNIYMVFFAMAYALSGYTLAFINQFMWMDAVILLPLVMLGIERLYKGEGGVVLYTVSLLLTIYSNFYIAWMVCIFAVLWFFLQPLIHGGGVKKWFFAAIRFGICSLAAGIVNLPVLIPLLGAIGNTLASDMGFTGELKFYHPVKEMLMMLLPGQASSLAFGAPNLYFGLVPLLLCPVALFSKEKIRAKAGYLLLFVFMFVSFNLNILDYIWHGLHFPNQLPGRQSFIFIFLGLVIAYKGFEVLMKSADKDRYLSLFIATLVCASICTEITYNGAQKMASEVKGVNESSVNPYDGQMSVVRENYTSDSKENEFWRVELQNHRYNGGQLYGYNGISHYSSTMSGDCYNFFLKLGMSKYAKNVSSEYIPNPVVNSLFAVRYIVSPYEKTDEVSENAGMAGNLYVHENSAWLPLFYVVSDDVLEVDMRLSGHSFTNDIFKKMTGCDDVIWGNGIYDKDGCEGYHLDTDEFLKGIEKIRESECTITDFGNTKIKGTVDAAEDGVLIISLPAKDVTVEIDGERVPVLTIAGYMAGAAITQGSHTVTIKLP